MDSLIAGFAAAMQPENLLLCLVGVALGTVIGLLPGLGSSAGIAVLLPLTLTLDPLPALIMLAGVYYGSEYGGTISAVLLGTPGDSGSLITVFEGHQMALRGRAGQALAIAAIGSFVAGTVTIVALSVTAPAFAQVALRFGPPEMFALMLLALTAIGGLVGRDRAKGYAMAAFGVMIGMVGLDPVTGSPRFSLGLTELLFGINLVAVIIGVIAFAELVTQGGLGNREPIRTRFRDLLLSRRDLRRSSGAIARGGVLGFVVGCLPGIGSSIPTFFSYDLERRLAARKGSEFGRGDIRGVAGPESANNAAANGAWVPTLALGIPGSGTTAILLGAFIVFGVRPGPLLLEQQGPLVWGLLASFYLGNLMLLVLNLPMAPLFASLLRVRYSYIYPVVLVVALVAAFSINNSLTEPAIAVVAGVFGFYAKRYGYPVAPLILGLILGPMLEAQLRRSISMGVGSPSIFLDRPIALVLFGVTAAIVALPLLLGPLRRRRRPGPPSVVGSAVEPSGTSEPSSTPESSSTPGRHR